MRSVPVPPASVYGFSRPKLESGVPFWAGAAALSTDAYLTALAAPTASLAAMMVGYWSSGFCWDRVWPAFDLGPGNHLRPGSDAAVVHFRAVIDRDMHSSSANFRKRVSCPSRHVAADYNQIPRTRTLLGKLGEEPISEPLRTQQR